MSEVADTVAELVRRYLSCPHLGGYGGGSLAEQRLQDTWRAELGLDLAEAWGPALREPDAVRLIELMQYCLGFYSGPKPARRATVDQLQKYHRELSVLFSPVLSAAECKEAREKREGGEPK